MLKSVRSRVLLSHLAIIGLVFGLTIMTAVIPIRRAQDRLEARRLTDLAAPIATQASFILQRPLVSNADIGGLLDTQARQLGIRIWLLSEAGEIQFDTDPEQQLTTASVEKITDSASELTSGRQPGRPTTHYLGMLDGNRVALAGVPGSGGRAIVLLSRADRIPLAREIFRPIAFATMIGLGGAVLATIFLSNSIAAPISRLRQAADAVAAGDLERTVSGEGDDEVGRLVRSFNGMVRQLNQTYISQRRLLSNVAHELRTPLTSIQGYADALREGLFVSQEEQADALKTISDESDRVNDLVGQILQLSRLESGLSEQRTQTFALRDLVKRVLRRYRLRAESSEVNLVDIMTDDLLLTANESLIDQAIDNLVQNALRHTPPGGTVTVTATRAARAKDRRPFLRIRVVDTGPGIPPEHIPFIFDRFHRAGAERTSASERTEGFGLGLAIVREIVAGHGGSVEVESQLGVGTTFIIELPLDATDASGGS